MGIYNDHVKVGAAKFVQEHAPAGMLATVTGLQGGAHNGLGKGFGGLLGGFTIEYTKSTHKAFRLFGFSCAAISILYIILAIGLKIRQKRRPTKERTGNGDGQEAATTETPKTLAEVEKLLEEQERTQPLKE